MPNFSVPIKRTIIERHLVKESITVVIQANTIEEAQKAVEQLEQVDSSALDDFEWELEEEGDIIGTDFLDSNFGNPVRTKKKAQLNAAEILNPERTE